MNNLLDMNIVCRRGWLVTWGVLIAILWSTSLGFAQQQPAEQITEAVSTISSSEQDGGQGNGNTSGDASSTDGGQNIRSVDSQINEAIQRLRDGDITFSDLIGVFDAFWSAELFRSGDSPVKVSQIVIALIIAVIGVLISRALAGFIRKRIESNSRVNAQTAAVVQKLIFYLATIVVVLVALPIAGIPITIFTVLGGALAIGVGFGAQNLFNNLISGFIILMERPIRINDIVEVESHRGKVVQIGNRSTRIRRFDGIDVLVPNSYFLENAVINWTLSDSHVRGEVMVGAAYGSPTKQVHDLMLEAAKQVEGVMHTPRKPEVIFEEFADNTLNFRIYFWTAVQRPLDLARIQSEVRYRIDDLFAQHNITIAFPQRDVHLDSLSPVQVKLVGQGESDPPETGGNQ